MQFSEVKAQIQKMRDEGKSYKYIGDLYGVNKGLIHMIVNDNHEPKKKKLRKKLGLGKYSVNFIRQVRTAKGTFASSTVLNHSEGDDNG
jgi:hypothetical protein